MKPRDQVKIDLFCKRFRGLEGVYGTYDCKTGRTWQVKAPVTAKVILDHLRGERPYGVYLLKADRTRAVVADFDYEDGNLPMEFIAKAQHYGVSAYIERSKSKGFHVWTFFETPGALAKKARAVYKHILSEMGYTNVEVFPKQDVLNGGYGNFIFTPLFGKLVPQGRTVFVNPDDGLRPYPNQWALLEGVNCVSKATLDEVIEINGTAQEDKKKDSPASLSLGVFVRPSCLPPCARRMLCDGVSENQRVSCFRLALHLKRVGLPYDLVAAVLQEWAKKNHPTNGKGIITTCEVKAQAAYAFMKNYSGEGCEDPAIAPYCDPDCLLRTGSCSDV